MKNLFINKWNLLKVDIIFEICDKGVYIVDSKLYGDSLLKINSNSNLKNEYTYLKSFDSNYVCKVYDYDDKGALLLERIIPGTSLRNEIDLHKRLDVYYQVSNELHKYKNDEFESYLDWFYKQVSYFAINNQYPLFQKQLSRAVDICEEIFSKYDNIITLHGDLHHDNILLNNDRYVVIDPKGVNGPPILEVGRFILNEMTFANDENASEYILDVIVKVSDKFNYDLEDVQKVFYMEVILANAWNIEDGIEVNEKQMIVASDILEWGINKKSTDL